jgi:hypothetical protein
VIREIWAAAMSIRFAARPVQRCNSASRHQIVTTTGREFTQNVILVKFNTAFTFVLILILLPSLSE